MASASLSAVRFNVQETAVGVKGFTLITLATAYRYLTAYNQEMESTAIYVEITRMHPKVLALILLRLMISTVTY
jgi:hypothetical protein